MKLFPRTSKAFTQTALCITLFSAPLHLYATSTVKPPETINSNNAAAIEAKRLKLIEELRPLALSYGATTAAWNRHSIGRLSLGFRYMLRDHYLAWLELGRQSTKKSYDELMAQAVKELQSSTHERPLKISQQAAPTGLLMAEFTNKMKEWTTKEASGRFYKGSRTLPEYAASNCLVTAVKGSTAAVLRQTSEACEPEVDAMSQWHENLEGKKRSYLMEKMKTYTAMFTTFLEAGFNFPLYREMVDNRTEFRNHLNKMFDAGLEPESISESLYRSGVYFEVVHNKVRYHFKRKTYGIPTPNLKDEKKK